jgi:hypothetical protein
MFLGDDDLKDLAKQAGVYDVPGIKALVNSPLLPKDKKFKLARWLGARAARRNPNPHPFLPAPAQEVAGNGIAELGLVVTGVGPEYPFRFREDHFVHMQVDGSTGAGKTLTLVALSIQLHRAGIPVWMFDTEGDVSALVLPLAPDIPVVTPEDVRFELFGGPGADGVNSDEYLSKLVSSFEHTLFAGDGMQSMCLEIALELRRTQGHFTIFDFHEALLRRKYRVDSREFQYWIALKNRFGGALIPFLGKTYGSGSHDIVAMMRSSVVWQLHGLSEYLLRFFLTALELLVQMASPVAASPGLGLELAIDEFMRVCGGEADRRTRIGESMTIDFMRTCRKRRIGVLLATQTPHLLPKPLLSLMNSWVVLRPVDGYYLRCVADALALDAEQERCLMELPDRGPRRAVVRCAGFPEAFLVELPEHRMRMAGAEEIEERRSASREWLAQIYRPLRGGAAKAVTEGAREEAPPPKEPEISKALLDYLVSCAREPFLSATERDRRLGIPAGTGNAYRGELERRGSLKLHRLQTGRRGGRVLGTEVTESGHGLLARFGAAVGKPRGRGSYEHKYEQWVIHQWGEARGYRSVIEHEVAGKAVDVYQVWEGEKVALEVVMEGLDKELRNVERDLEAGFDRVVLCAVGRETLGRLRAKVVDKLGEELVLSGKVRFVRLASFLDAGGGECCDDLTVKRKA